MITIDGSYGEGGGQILRTSLALSLVTGKPFSIRNIRAGRKKPGLMRQHLTAVNAAAEIGLAAIEGNRIGSQAFTFEPETIKPGNFHFAIGSAGSCTLVFQTILPALLIAGEPTEIILEGGTHNPFAPPFDFLEKAFLPVINRMGPRVDAVLEKPGFYPAGGGRFRVSVNPADLNRFDLLERGNIINKTARACVANLPVNIANRELEVIHEKLEWDRELLKAVEVENSQGPGNILTVEVESDNITEVFTGFGEKGVSAEKVARRAVKSVQEYLAFNVPMGRYLADQLLIPMALAGGGKFRTFSPTKHTTTNAEIIKKFIDVEIEMNECSLNQWEIEIWNG
ncbi:RNA 3'-terminal phosphate cyclase (EC [Olavius sp. associated proteobacterium Delta 1]|nr:RNA 3'-terminal phosphate cyclase (EC [Olavius sp. associated proteobacterium Delta 1]